MRELQSKVSFSKLVNYYLSDHIFSHYTQIELLQERIEGENIKCAIEGQMSAIREKP